VTQTFLPFWMIVVVGVILIVVALVAVFVFWRPE
jgi:hypothetical protein